MCCKGNEEGGERSGKGLRSGASAAAAALFWEKSLTRLLTVVGGHSIGGIVRRSPSAEGRIVTTGRNNTVTATNGPTTWFLVKTQEDGSRNHKKLETF
ncbi:hypothetical protein Ddc_08855 [Ditylenchus destructor]|nr:hypothetical protein Ddc_08855 [Ditylenchus destructor]